MEIRELKHDSKNFDEFYNKYSNPERNLDNIFDYESLKTLLENQSAIPSEMLANFYFKIFYINMNDEISAWVMYSYFPDINSAFIEDIYCDSKFSDFNFEDVIYDKFVRDVYILVKKGNFVGIDHTFCMSHNPNTIEKFITLKFLKKKGFQIVDFNYNNYFKKDISLSVLTYMRSLPKNTVIDALYFHIKYIEGIFNPPITEEYKRMIVGTSNDVYFYLKEISC